MRLKSSFHQVEESEGPMLRTLNSLDEPLSTVSPTDKQDAGFGALETPRGVLPLVALEVRAKIAGLVAHTTVRQVFRNPLEEPLEATYVFPLPDRAAVTSFRMKVADRVVEGELKERSQAREDYAKAIEEGHRAAIAEEDRSGVFSLRVGNIPAHEEISVELSLVGPLPVNDGEAMFRFPLVVAPRYVSGMPLDGPQVGRGWGPDTDEAPDASRVTPPVLLPGFPNPVKLSLEVELDPAGVGMAANQWAEQIRSSLHSVILKEGPPWTIRLQPGERLNRDFILRFPVAATAVQTTLLCSPANKSEPGTFLLMLVPPAVDRATRPAPRDLVIVLDRSGSMGGWKMVAARRAVGRVVDSLLEQDRFTVLAFDNTVEYPSHAREGLVEATDRNRARTLEWLDTIDARGGTEMGPALENAMRHLAADASRQRVLLLVTDGQVAGEDAVLRRLQQSAGHHLPRIHTIGIDMAVNAAFLQRLAGLGGGTCDVVESEERLEAAMDGIHRAIGAPALTGLHMKPREFKWLADSLAPSRIPDLYPDRPVMILGRHMSDASTARVLVSGVDAQGKPWQQEVSARPAPADLLLSLWGRAMVRELEDRYAAGGRGDMEALAKRIVEVSLSSHVLSRFTAYTAIDRSEVVNRDGKRHEIIQPVEAPAGWDMLAAAPARSMGVSMKRCMTVRAPLFGALSDACESLAAPLARASLPQLRRSELSVRPVAELSAEIRSVVEKVEKSLGSPPRSQRKHWKQLLELLQQLAGALRQSGHTAADEVEKLVQRGNEIVGALDRGGKHSVEPGPAQECLTSIGRLLESIAASAQPGPKREKFWT